MGLAVKKLNDHVKSGTAYTTNYALCQSNEDILIFGASEVSHSLITSQITDSLGFTCFNLGMDGTNIYYQYALLIEILKRHKPKIVIISTNVMHEDNKSSLAPLFPYYYDYQSVRKIVLDFEPNERYKLLIKGYAYNSLILSIIQGIIVQEPDTKGYIPLYQISKNLRFPNAPFKINITDKSLKYFEMFLRSCLNSGCEVYVIAPPRYVREVDNEMVQKINTLLGKYSIEYLNYCNDTTFLNHPAFFKDEAHLNHYGAPIFTNMVIKSIRQGLVSKDRSATYGK